MKLIDIQRNFFRIKGDPENTYFCTKADTDAMLNVQKVWYVPCNASMQIISDIPAWITGDELDDIMPLEDTLGMAYTPASDIHKLNTNTPDSMGYDLHEALKHLKEAVGNVTDFVCERLQWSRDQIEERLFAEQVDAVALTIYNFEARNQAMIIGDQTGIGKGRVASSIIRYAMVHGMIPVYCTEKDNLFTDNYRDLSDIGCGDLVPFIVNNGATARVTTYDEESDKDIVVHSPLGIEAKEKIFRKLGEMPINPKTGKEFDYILLTYSQLNKAYKQGKKGEISNGEDFQKLAWLKSIADNCIYIFDESHNISGSRVAKTNWWKGENSDVKLAGSNVFIAFGLLANEARHSLFLSATYAKRPENLVIYAQKTCIQDAQLDNTALISTIANGGEALQEIISSAIVKEGQMIRRESNYSGIETNYIYLNKDGQKDYGVADLEAEHRSKCDFITAIINKMNQFEKEYVIPAVESKSVGTSSGKANDKKLGASHDPIFSKLHQIVSQLLYCIKTPAVADHAVSLLNQGKKVVIAVSNTMAAHFDGYSTDEYVNCDFSEVLNKGLERMFKYRMEDKEDHSTWQSTLPIDELPEEGQRIYYALKKEIEEASSGITMSPIDYMIRKIQSGTYKVGNETRHWKVGEVTGRDMQIELTNEEGTEGILRSRTKEKKNVVFSMFQNNKLDVLIINAAGSTGASAHATTKGTNLKPEEVKPRVMIIAQSELDINTEVQKRGRINRTGQLRKIPPRYDYLISAIPAETRLMMILQKKLRSLDANTTSNQKQSRSIIDTPDFINSVGDEVCDSYLSEHPEILSKLNMDGGEESQEGSRDNKKVPAKYAEKVTRYVPVLQCEEQEDFYNSISEGYEQLVKDLKMRGEYNLEVENIDLDARLIGQPEVVISRKSGNSSFADAVYKCKFDCKNLNRPYNRSTIEAMISNYCQGRDAKEIAAELAFKLAKNFEPGFHAIQAKYTQRIKEAMERIEKRKAKAEKKGDAEEVAKCEKDLQETLKVMNERMESMKARKKVEIERKKYIEFFYAGRAVMINSIGNIRGICLGTKITNKSEHGFNLSNVVISFAVGDSSKRLDLNLSDKDAFMLDVIKVLTNGIEAEGDDLDKRWIEGWNEATKELNTDRETRTIIMGNILTGYDKALKFTEEQKESGQSTGKAKLISFTTANKEVLKGVLLPRESRFATLTMLSQYEIRAMVPHFKKLLKTGEPGFFYLNRGVDLYINNDGESLKLIIKSQKTFNELSKHCYSDFEALDYRSRTFEAQRNMTFDFKCIRGQEGLVFDLLEKYDFKVELMPAQAEKLFPASAKLQKTNWQKLDVDYNNIPANTSIMENEMELMF